MKCAACRPLLSKYVDHETPPAETRLVEEHLGTCASCSAALTEFRLARSLLAGAPQRRPDPRIREQLFRALDAYDAAHPVAERPRAARPQPVPARPAARPAWAWLGNLVAVAAVLLVAASGMLLARISIQNTPVSGPGSRTPDARTPLAVPTQPLAILASPQQTSVSTLALASGESPAPHTATGTPAWQPVAEPPGTTHKIRDARFGYGFTYPANWWSAVVAAPGGVLGRRRVVPWPLDRPDAGPAYQVLIDVLANPQHLTLALAQQAGLLPAGDTQPVRYGALTGVHLQRSADGAALDEVYLLQDTVIYRLSAVVPQAYNGSKDPADLAARTSEAVAQAETIRASFQPTDSPPGEQGYAPALVLRNGDLWAVDPDGSNPRALTSGGLVRAFRLAPDLRRVALIVAASAGAPGLWGSRVALLTRLDGKGAPQNLWISNQIHDLDWYSNDDLLVIADDPAAKQGLALYHIPVGVSADGPRRLTDLAAYPTAGALHVSPDRQWIGFLADTTPGSHVGELYGVRPDGSSLGALTPRIGGNQGIHDVREFAWLAAAQDTAPPGSAALVLLERQGDGPNAPVAPTLLTVPPPGAGSPRTTALDGSLAPGQQARLLTVNAQGQVAYALFDGAGAWQGLRLCSSQVAPSTSAQTVGLHPATGQPQGLAWAPDGSHLLLQTGTPAGAVTLERLDRATGVAVTLLQVDH